MQKSTFLLVTAEYTEKYHSWLENIWNCEYKILLQR